MTICCVKGCGKERFPGCGLHFHRIPDNPELKEKWLNAIPLEGKLTKNSTVCSNHFESNDYVTLASNDQKFRCLKQGVIPSIFTKVESIEQDSEESGEDQLNTNKVKGTILNKASSSMRATNVLAENKISKIMLARPALEGNKIMVVTPISNINKIEDVITIKPNVSKEDTQPSSRVKTIGTSVMGRVGGVLNNLLTQKQANKIIVVKPIAENEKIEKIISTKTVSNSDDSDVSSVSSDSEILSDSEKSILNNLLTQKQANKIIGVKPTAENEKIEKIISTKKVSNSDSDVSSVSSDSEIFSDCEKFIPFSEKIYIKEATPERMLKRKYVQETPIDMYGGSKISRKSNLDAKETNSSQDTSKNAIKYHVATQTGPYTTGKEQELKKKIKVLRQKIHRRVTAFNQMKTILNLIKNKCRNYAEVKEVLTLKLKQLPENLNCDGVIIAP